MINFLPNSYTLLSLKIGSLTLDIRWYAFLIMLGAFGTYIVSRSEFKRAKYTDLDFFDSLFIYTLWFGILGARLWFCIFFNFSYYFSNPIEIIRIWDGGLAIQGGLFAGAIFAYFYCKAHKYPFLKILDIVLPNVLIGQAFGRWGNFVNKECHGSEVSEEYFNGILSFLKEGMYIDGHYYEPLFFYESVLCLLGFIIIHFVLRKKQNRRGDLAYAYLMWYGVIRFFIEAKRTDSLYLGNIKMAQLTSVVFVIVGLLGYLGKFVKYTNKNKPTIMFDFDGTLIDTSASIKEAYRECFRVYSDESLFTEKIQEEIMGPALKDLFPKYFPGVDYDTLYETYHNKQFAVADKLNKVMPNAKEILEYLHNEGYKIGIISTRTKDGILKLLDANGLSGYIDDICGLSDVENLKPNPEGIINMVNKNKWNRDLIMIGDSLMDIECGTNYGAYTVAYLSNPSRKEQLSKCANESIDDLLVIKEIVNKNISFTYNKL